MESIQLYSRTGLARLGPLAHQVDELLTASRREVFCQKVRWVDFTMDLVEANFLPLGQLLYPQVAYPHVPKTAVALPVGHGKRGARIYKNTCEKRYAPARSQLAEPYTFGCGFD